LRYMLVIGRYDVNHGTGFSYGKKQGSWFWNSESPIE